MRIAIICTGIWPLPATKGGAVASLLENLMRVNETENKVEFFTFCSYDRDAFIQSKQYKRTHFKYYHIPFLCSWLDKLLYFIVKWFTGKPNLQTYRNIVSRSYMLLLYVMKIDVEKFDRIVIISNPSLFLLLKFKKFRDVSAKKIIYYVHNEIRSLSHCEKELKNILGFLCVSQFISDSIKNTYSVLSDSQRRVLKNCIDTKLFSNVSEDKILSNKKKFGIKNNDFIIMFAGRLSEEKGALEVIRAVKKLPDSIPYKLLVVGNSFFSSDVVNSYVLDLCKESEDIKDKIIMTGYVRYEEMPAIYKLGQVAILPSIWEEPAGLTMLEAAIAGVPLITTYSGGIPEYIPRDAAIFLERNDSLIDNITLAIQDLFYNYEIRNKLTANGMRLSEIYNLKNFYNNFVDVIKNFEI